MWGCGEIVGVLEDDLKHSKNIACCPPDSLGLKRAAGGYYPGVTSRATHMIFYRRLP
jgi:hypothetical protein